MACLFSARNYSLLTLLVLSLHWIPSFENENEIELTPDECKNPGEIIRKKCCQLGEKEIAETLSMCLYLQKELIPKGNEKNCAFAAKFFACSMECIFKEKEYISESAWLDMKLVKLDISSQFRDDDAKKKFMIEKYKFCKKQATMNWDLVKNNMLTKVIFRLSTCKPIYMFLQSCLHFYAANKTIECPYNVWAAGKQENEEMCNELISKCEDFED